MADKAGFTLYSMGEHYNIPALQRVHQIPALARLCAEVKHCEVGTAVMLLGLRHPVTVANEARPLWMSSTTAHLSQPSAWAMRDEGAQCL